MNSESPWATKRPVPFTNVSGETIPAFAAMAIIGLVHENGIAFLECGKPSTTFVREYAVNNMFDVPAGLRGTCFRAGDLRVLYDADAPAAGEGWGPKPAQWSLSRGYPGFSIQGIVDSQHRLAKTFIEPIDQVLIKTTAPVAAGATTADYRVYAGTFGSETDAGFTTVPTASNRTGQSLAIDEWGWLAWTGGGWELRCNQNRVYHGTYVDSPLPAGAAGSITLPDGRTVGFLNWSTDTILDTNDRILIWQDFTDGNFYGIRSGAARVRWFHATLASPGLSSADPIANVTTTAALDGGAHPGSVTANNTWGCAGQTGTAALVVRDAWGNYELVKVKAFAVEATTEIKYDETSERILKYRRKKLAAMQEEAESDWQNIFTAESHEMVSAVIYTPADNKLFYNTLTVYTLPDFGAGNTIPIHTMIEQTVVDNVTITGTGQLSFDKQTLTVWETAEGSTDVLQLFTTSLLAVVVDVGQTGINIYQDKYLVNVLNPISGPFRSVALFGEMCQPESPGTTTLAASELADPNNTAAIVAATHYF
jgi:hypothetical protein